MAIVNPDDKEELALTLEAKKNKLKREDFEKLGKNLGLNDRQLSRVFNRLLINKPRSHEWLDKSFLSDSFKQEYKALMEQRYTVLFS